MISITLYPIISDPWRGRAQAKMTVMRIRGCPGSWKHTEALLAPWRRPVKRAGYKARNRRVSASARGGLPHSPPAGGAIA